MREFHKARVRLTMQYTLVLFLITGTITSLYYIRTSRIIDLQFHLIETRIQKGDFLVQQIETPKSEGNKRRFSIERTPAGGSRILKNELTLAREQIKSQLLLINALVLLLGATSSYFLSGKTLRPIKKSLLSQQRFVADAAHELKTPITALKTSLEVSLMDTGFDKKSKKILKDNFQAVSSLESLTENLLKLARVKNNDKSSFSPTKLSKIINRAKNHVEPLAKLKNISFNIEKYDKKLSINGNEDSLVEVLMILLDNAVKFSPKKSTISISIKQSRRTISIFVADNGLGISKKDQSKIFKRFYRVDKSRSKIGEGGYGLGLAVAKDIVGQHGGKIRVNSSDNGSIFKVSLPVA